MAGWYRQGTVALTPGSAAVAGAGTMWMGVVRPGSAFTTDGRTLYEIREVANDHTLTLDRPWEGETAAASAYAVIAASATLSNAELAGEIAAMVAKWAVREDQYDDWLGGSPTGGPNADGKYPLTDSKGVTRLVESPARLLQLLDDGVVEHAAQIIAAIEDDVATARQAATAATAAMTTVSADRQAVAQAAATVAAQTGESTAAAATATAQAAIAVHHADEAANSAAAAAGLEASATAALAAVETARDIVLEARTEAGTAATGALASRTAAEAARDTATAARDAALEARDAAETARTQAQDWAVKTDAPVSGSLKSALSYALDAASQATVATGKAMEASGSAAAAAASAAGLDTAATAAQAAAGDAATGAQTATVKAAAAALSADTARSAAQQAETAGSGSATARAAAEAARDSAATAMTAAQVAASQAGQSQTNAANSAQTAATAAADAISAKSDATSARDLAVAARTEAQGARDLAQAFAQGAVGYQPSPGVYSAFHWSEQAKGHAQTAATIVGGSNFGIVGDGTSQRFAADNPGSLLNLVQAPGGKLTFNPGNRAVSFGFDAATAPVAASGGITAGTVQGALEEIDHRLSTLSQDSIANGGGSVQVTEDGTVEITPAAGRTATYKGGELQTTATAYGKAQTDTAIAAATNGLATVARTGAYDDLLHKPDVYTRSQTDGVIAAMVTAGQSAGATKLTTPRTIALTGGVTGTATAFDGTQNIAIPVTAVAASALTGTIPLANMPAAALERLVIVSSQTARYALTTATVQVGDVVKETDTGKMFYLKDETNIGNSAGWEEYLVGTAALANSAPWAGVTGRPALLDAIAALDGSTGLILQTSANSATKRAIGVASSTDIPDRSAADGRYAQLGTASNFTVAPTISGNAVWHAGNDGAGSGLDADLLDGLQASTSASANSIAQRDIDGSLYATRVQTAGGTAILAMGSNADPLDAYYQINGSTNTSLAGARSLNLIVNTGGYGLYTGRLSPQRVYTMDATTKVIDFAQTPTVNGAALNANTVTKSAVTVLPAAGTINVTAKSILAVYSQFVGQTFNVDYNTEAQYTQENAATGTDQIGGAFQLYNTAGAQIDANTKLLIHADGPNGSTEIIDERGITPFGTHCGYFDGASSWKVPVSYKIAFGQSQDFTYEFWMRPQDTSNPHVLFDLRTSAGTEPTTTLHIEGGTFRLNTGGVTTRINAGSVVVDTWAHVAYVRRSGTGTLYVNGASIGTWADTTVYANSPIYIGVSGYNSTSFFLGWMDQFRVSKIARYTANFTPPTTAFTTDADTVHLFTFDDGHGGQVLKDRANSGRAVLIGGIGAAISSEQAKFGTTSFKLGTSGSCVIGWGSTPHADLAFGNDNFTVDFWIYKTNTGDAVLWSGGNNAYAPQLRTNGAGGAIAVYLSTDNASWNISGSSTGAVPTVNAWNHIAITRSGTTCYVFLNGAVIGTYTVGTGSFTMNGPYHYFGGASDNSAIMAGYIDEVRIKRSEAAWISAFTPPTAAYTTDDRTVLLLHFDGNVLDSSRSSYGTNAFGDTMTPALTFQSGAALAATQTRGGHATSLTLAGSQYAAMVFATPSAGHPIYFGANTKLCVEGWFYVANLSANYELFSLVSTGTGTAAFRCYINQTSGTVTAAVATGVTISGGTSVSIGWNHIALIREGRGWSLAVNGTLSIFASPQANSTFLNEGYTFYLGAMYSGGVINQGVGACDAFRITNGQPRYTANFTPATLTNDDMTTLFWEFNGAVGQKWVKELSQNTALIMATANARTVKDGAYITPIITAAGNIGISTTDWIKFGTGALKGVGITGNGLMLPHSSAFCPTGDFTIDFWANLTASAGRIAYKTNGTNSTIGVYWSGTQLQAVVFDNSGNGYNHVVSCSTGVHHIALVKYGTNLTFYIDGVYAGAITIGATIRQDTSGPLYLMMMPDNNQPFSGQIDEFRWSNTARWTSNFTPPTIPYGQQYVTGPFYVATLNNSRIDVSDWSTIHSATITQSTPPSTTIKWVVSFDGRATWRKWDGSAWVAVPLDNGSSIDTNGNDVLTMQNALANLNVESYSTIDFAFSLKTANPNFSPSVDAVTLARDEYELGAAKTDYTIRRNGAVGAEIHRITNLKPYPVNVVYDYVA